MCPTLRHRRCSARRSLFVIFCNTLADTEHHTHAIQIHLIGLFFDDISFHERIHIRDGGWTKGWGQYEWSGTSLLARMQATFWSYAEVDASRMKNWISSADFPHLLRINLNQNWIDPYVGHEKISGNQNDYLNYFCVAYSGTKFESFRRGNISRSWITWKYT